MITFESFYLNPYFTNPIVVKMCQISFVFKVTIILSTQQMIDGSCILFIYSLFFIKQSPILPQKEVPQCQIFLSGLFLPLFSELKQVVIGKPFKQNLTIVSIQEMSAAVFLVASSFYDSISINSPKFPSEKGQRNLFLTSPYFSINFPSQPNSPRSK